MIFNISIKKLKQSNSDLKVQACLRTSSTNDTIEDTFGSFKYYLFIKEFFEDISFFQRVGDVSIAKHDPDEVCVFWHVNSFSNGDTFRSEIANGVRVFQEELQHKYASQFEIDEVICVVNKDHSFIEPERVNVTMIVTEGRRARKSENSKKVSNL